MKARGFTLVELLVGGAVASIVGAIALAVLCRAGLVAARWRIEVRRDDAAWLALAAIARDLRVAPEWRDCRDSWTCPRAARRASNALVAGDVAWFADGALRRCQRREPKSENAWNCARFLDGISTAAFTVDLRQGGGRETRHEPAKRDGNTADTIDVTLWTYDSKSYSRTTEGPPSAD